MDIAIFLFPNVNALDAVGPYEVLRHLTDAHLRFVAPEPGPQFTEEGTLLTREGVSEDTWANVRKHYDDEQTAALVCLVGLINAANRMAVITRQKGGSYQTGAMADFKA